ncbi:MAG TPA: OmpW family outer membrane protein [Burkholderiaceae bacterium]|nr:OmpW family outer membrane protein [Burkholderiaceae bacterium]
MTRMAVLALAGAVVMATSAAADDLVLRAGVHNVDPKSDNNPVVNVDSNATLSLGATWFFTPNVALDVLGALPFKHDIRLNGGPTVASTKQLPPTIDLQYHFLPHAAFDPYIGAGVNYTLFFDKQTTGPLAGSKLSLDNSFGVALQLGGDFTFAKDWVVGVDLRWIRIKTEAKVDGASIGDVKIDPLVYGVTIGRRLSL